MRYIYVVIFFCMAMSLNNLCMEEKSLKLHPDIIGCIMKFKDAQCANHEDIHHLPSRSFSWTIPPTLFSFMDDSRGQVPRKKIYSNIDMEMGSSIVHVYRYFANQLWSEERFAPGGLDQDYLGRSSLKNCIENYIYDGFNKKNTAVIGYTDLDCETYPINYGVFISKLSKQGIQKNRGLNPVMTNISGLGTLLSLMLENERNRIMYSIRQNDGVFELHMRDLPKKHEEVLSWKLYTDQRFIKTVSLGKNTYFGITDEGSLYSLWLGAEHNIELAQQKFSQQFADIAVDNETITASGFHPKIAFVTTVGDIYVTFLDEDKQSTLYYVTTIDKVDCLERFFYKNGKLLIIYKKDPIFREIQDNFGLLYGCALLKRLYQ